MAEEQRCQEGHRLCANNCGFFGSPATLDLCSKCYRDLRLKEEQASSAKIAVEKTLSSSSASSPFSSLLAASSTSSAVHLALAPEDAAVAEAPAQAAPLMGAADQEKRGPSRCATCRKRVGLTGFECRCGVKYCGAHRYPEQHACVFDYKAAGREAIARANPVVKADKLDRI